MELPSDDEIARALGGEVRGGRVYFPGPDHTPDDRSAWFKRDPYATDGYIVGSFSPRDDWRTIKDLVRERLRLQRQPTHTVRPLPPRPTAEPDLDQRGKAQAALAIFEAAGDIRGTIAADYLRCRGLGIDRDLSHVLRFHGGLRFKGSRVAGIVAAYRDVITNQLCGIHRTFLDDAGRKLDRRMLGRAKGSAIKLDADANVTLGLHVGEGIETCLTARQLGFRPVWALGSAGAIASLPVLKGVEAITFLAEHDDNDTNLQAIQQCSERYIEAGVDVFVVDPPRGDLNDFARRAS